MICFAPSPRPQLTAEDALLVSSGVLESWPELVPESGPSSELPHREEARPPR